MGKEVVTKSNSLINASYYLNLGEYRLITSSVALARKAGLGITADRPLKISVQEFASLYNLDRTTAYKMLRSACDSLFERQISYLETLDGRKMISRTRWVQRVSYSIEGEGVELVFSSDVAPHIAGLSDKFTTFYIENIKKLRSPYAVRLYEQFSRWKNAGSTPEIDPEELKRLMGVEPHLYTTIRLFNRLLVSCVEKINKHTDLQVTLHQIKNWRTVKGYKFDVVVRDSVDASPTTLKLSTYQQRTWAEKLVAAMDFNKEIRHRLERFPESYSPNHAILINAVAEKLANPKIAATFLPLLRQVGFGKGGRKRPHKNEDIKPIRVVHEDGTVDDKTGDLFNGEG